MIILICVLVSFITSAITIWHLRHINRMLKYIYIYIDCTKLTLSVKKDIEE